MSSPNPLALFTVWFTAAARAETSDHTAMSLATADSSGRPAVRMVLLKHFDERGFVFYTNLESPKSHDLRENPHAALCFHWPKLSRQIRIEGTVVPTSPGEADAYFATRPRLSRLAAWASRQSAVMSSRFQLQREVAAAGIRYGAGPVPRPPHWSGWRVVHQRVEFWRERAFRHHERRLFIRDGQNWRLEWLFP